MAFILFVYAVCCCAIVVDIVVVAVLVVVVVDIVVAFIMPYSICIRNAWQTLCQ